MTLELRPMPLADVQARFSAEELARQRRSRALLAQLGLIAPPSEFDLLTGRVIVWECIDGTQVVGHCTGDCLTGEILSLEVNASHAGRGIGRMLLFHVAGQLRAAGAREIWLIGPADRRVRAHGFYRAVGCRRTGTQVESGNDILGVPAAAELHPGEGRRTAVASSAPVPSPARSQSIRYITRASTRPSRGWRKAAGRRPTSWKP